MLFRNSSNAFAQRRLCGHPWQYRFQPRCGAVLPHRAGELDGAGPEGLAAPFPESEATWDRGDNWIIPLDPGQGSGKISGSLHLARLRNALLDECFFLVVEDQSLDGLGHRMRGFKSSASLASFSASRQSVSTME